MTYRVYEVSEIIKIIEEYNNGSKQSELSKKYNIPRSNIRYWLNNNEKFNQYNKLENQKKLKNNCDINNYLSDKKLEYNYILGLYLGDGHIIKTKRSSYQIRIFLDSKYYNIVTECENNLKILFPFNKINIHKTKYNMFIVSVYSNSLKYLFPQIGKGVKHKRKIILEDFQIKNINHKNIIRGLFHSDGCLYKNTIIKKEGKKYFGYYYNFSNMSKDIVDIYCNSLDIINIHYTIQISKDNCYRINVNRRVDFKKMYEFLGVKNLNIKSEVDEYYYNIIRNDRIKKLKSGKKEIKINNNLIKNYCACGKEIKHNSKQCYDCYRLSERKVKNRPTKDELRLMISDTSLEAVGRVYGVTGKAVKKWLK